MSVQIEVPSVGESVNQVTVYQWLKKDGDYVEKDAPVVELETDKVNQELNAPEAGVLRIKAEEGSELEVGAVLGSIEPGDKPAGSGNAGKAKDQTPTEEAAEEKESEEEDSHGSRATPVAKKVAAEYGVDLKTIEGHGVGGRVTKGDVLDFVEKNGGKETKPATESKPERALSPADRMTGKEQPEEREVRRGKDEKPPVGEPDSDRQVSRRKLSQLRRRIAARLVEAQQSAAILTTFNEVDMTAVMEARAKYKEKFKEKHGIGLGFMSFFVKAAVVALQEFPNINSYLDGDELIEHHYCDVGVAVGTDRGLVVPVIRNAERLSFAGVEKAIRDFATRAQDGKLTLDELSGGTFTISNGGVYGSMLSTPILNPPQSGILGMHNIQKRPMVIDDEVAVRPMMYVALSYDHRIVDGKEAVSFLVRIKECIEDPERILLDI